MAGQALSRREDTVPLTGLDVFEQGTLPRWAPVRQLLDADEVADMAQAVADELTRPGTGDAITPGARVAILAGSRGVDRVAEVIRALADGVRSRGGVPFVVPAMGSHGGATAEGQAAILAHYGITEASVGCPVRSCMDTVHLGDVLGDVPVYVDRLAYEEADLVIPVNRVKPHTDFAGPVESGLAKMLAIGLGKQKGADAFHSRGYGKFPRLIPAVAASTLTKVPIPFGVALVENAFSRCALVEAVPAARLADREPELLVLARERLGRLPEPPIDVLVVDRIGKDVSGAGADPNVLNRDFVGIVDRSLDRPRIQRVVFRDLTDDTEGNATGVALADVVTRRLVDRVDVTRTYMNALTSKNPESARVPLTADDDRQALHLALACCVGTRPETARIARIESTKHVDHLWASEPLLPDLLATGRVEQLGEPEPVRFDAAGMLAED